MLHECRMHFFIDDSFIPNVFLHFAERLVWSLWLSEARRYRSYHDHWRFSIHGGTTRHKTSQNLTYSCPSSSFFSQNVPSKTYFVHPQVHVAREVCLGISPIQSHASRYIMADVSSVTPGLDVAALPGVTWIDLSSCLPIPEHEAIHDLSTNAARIAAAASGEYVPPPSDVRICLTGSALAIMWDSSMWMSPKRILCSLLYIGDFTADTAQLSLVLLYLPEFPPFRRLQSCAHLLTEERLSLECVVTEEMIVRHWERQRLVLHWAKPMLVRGFVRNRHAILTFYDQEWLHRSAAVTRASQA